MRKYTVLIITFIICSCSSSAIIPAKLTYTYPLGDVMTAQPEQAKGVVAYLDDGTLELFLPLFNEKMIKPMRYVFLENETGNVFTERKDNEFTARILPGDEEIVSSAGDRISLQKGVLVIQFPNNDIYQKLSGKTIWLNLICGYEEVYQISGLYLKTRYKP